MVLFRIVTILCKNRALAQNTNYSSVFYLFLLQQTSVLYFIYFCVLELLTMDLKQAFFSDFSSVPAKALTVYLHHCSWCVLMRLTLP